MSNDPGKKSIFTFGDPMVSLCLTAGRCWDPAPLLPAANLSQFKSKFRVHWFARWCEALNEAADSFYAILLQHCLMWNIRGSLIWFYFMVTLCLGLAMRIFVWKNYWFKIFRSTIHIICVPLLRREPLSHLTFKSSQQIPSGARKNVSVKNYFHSILTTFLCPEPILLSSRLSAPRLLGNLWLAANQ